MAKSDNRSVTDKPKRKAPRTAWKKGQPSPNPAGAPKRGESWAEIIKRIGEMTPPEAAALSLELTKKLLAIGDGVTLKQAVVLRAFADLLHEPTAGMLVALMDRADGKVTQPVSLTWQSPYVELIRARKVTFAQLAAELDTSLAVELFALAGVEVTDAA